MTHPASLEINRRFYFALDSLQATGQIKSINEFCIKHKIDPGNLVRLRKEPSRSFELAFLNYLVEHYRVSAHWLITGNGDMILH